MVPSSSPSKRAATCLLRHGSKRLQLNGAAKALLDGCSHGRNLLRHAVVALAQKVLRGRTRASCALALDPGQVYRLRARAVRQGADKARAALCHIELRHKPAASAPPACAPRATVDHLPYPVWLADAKGYAVDCNLAAENMLGRPEHDAHSRASWPLHAVHPDDRQAITEGLRAARAEGRAFDVCCRFSPNKDAAFRWHVLRSQPRKNDDARVVGWVTTLQDEQAAYEMRENLRVAVGLRNNFLRVASHELSTPLTSLQLALQLANARIKRVVPSEPDRAPVAEPLHRALDDTRRLVDLVSDLLDIKRLQVGKFFLRRSQVDLGEMLQDLLTRLAKPLQDAGCQVAFAREADVTGSWDLVRLQQVFFHLLSNVIKYAPGSRVVLRCGLQLGGCAAWVSVEDEGPGIPAGLRKKIFGLFERATEVRGTSGLGMGLYLCRRIVNAHHGHLRLISRHNKGAKFVVDLPRQPAGSDAALQLPYTEASKAARRAPPC